MPTGRATPWPNRAETAVRLFKRQYEKLLMDALTHPTLNKVTLRDLIRECCWARNTTLTISGYTPVELATGRRPTDHSDLELMKPDQLSVADLPRDATLNELRKLALKAHLEARQSRSRQAPSRHLMSHLRTQVRSWSYHHRHVQ